MLGVAVVALALGGCAERPGKKKVDKKADTKKADKKAGKKDEKKKD